MKRLKDIMTCGVETLDPLSTIQAAAQKMKSYDVGLLPVCESGRVVGALTDRDIALRVIAEGRDASRTLVRDVMTRDVVCGHELQDVQEAAELMRANRIRRLPVLDRQKRLVGLVSLGKLTLCDEENVTGEVLRDLVAPPAR
jgi:CBS domain-containing protein